MDWIDSRTAASLCRQQASACDGRLCTASGLLKARVQRCKHLTQLTVLGDPKLVPKVGRVCEKGAVPDQPGDVWIQCLACTDSIGRATVMPQWNVNLSIPSSHRRRGRCQECCPAFPHHGCYSPLSLPMRAGAAEAPFSTRQRELLCIYTAYSQTSKLVYAPVGQTQTRILSPYVGA